MLSKLLNLFVPPVSQEKFTLEAAQYLQTLEPGFRVETVAPLELKAFKGEDEPVQIYLANAYINYLKNRLHRKDIIARYVSSLVEADVESLLPKNVIPTIKDKAYLVEVREQLKAQGQNPEEYFVTEEYNDELAVVYAVDSPASIRFLNSKDLPDLNLHGQPLREFAVDNLKAILPAVEVHGKPPFFALKAGGMFESSLLLLDRVWNKAELGIEGEIVAAVPSRDVLLVADSSSEKAIEQIRKKAREVAAAAAYRLTDKLFIRKGGKFELMRNPQ